MQTPVFMFIFHNCSAQIVGRLVQKDQKVCSVAESTAEILRMQFPCLLTNVGMVVKR